MKILDAHTHLSGSASGESSAHILATLDACGVQTAFIFAPLLDVRDWHMTAEHLADIRAHNDYCADLCSASPERLLGFCVLNPSPAIANGSSERAVRLMVEEAQRSYHELGLRGVKMVPSGWYPDDRQIMPLYEALVDLGMYVVFHTGIFLDGREGRYCRPAFYEGIHQVPRLRAQLAHVGWPWVDECLAVLAQETLFEGDDPTHWQLRADVSFGPPDDWQLETWQKSLGILPHQMLCYGSDVFWPFTPERYDNQFLRPQLGLFETAATNSHVAEEGSPERSKLRERIFNDNAWEHWQLAVHEPQRPRRTQRPISTPKAKSERRMP